MADKPVSTVGDLRRAAEITDDEIDAAVEAYRANKAEPFRFAAGYEVDVAAAVNAYGPSEAAVSDPDRTPKFKWTMVRTAILLAPPVKG